MQVSTRRTDYILSAARDDEYLSQFMHSSPPPEPQFEYTGQTQSAEDIPPESVSPAPDPQPRLPAILRVLLYLPAQIPAVLASLFVVRWGLSAVAISPDPTVENLPGSLWDTVELNIAYLAGIVGLTALFVRLLDRRPFRTIGFQWVPGLWLHWVLGFLIEGLHIGTLFLLGYLAGWYRIVDVTVGYWPVILREFVILWLPAAAVEEIVCRGYVHQTIESRYGTWWGVAVNSLLFALMHTGNPAGARFLTLLGLFVSGVYLTVAYLATRQLWLPIAMHAGWNVLEGPVFGLPVSGIVIQESILHVETHGPALWTGGAFGPEAGVPILITTVLWTALVWAAARRLLPQRAAIVTDGPIET
jgi:CAAX protease family protein